MLPPNVSYSKASFNPGSCPAFGNCSTTSMHCKVACTPIGRREMVCEDHSNLVANNRSDFAWPIHAIGCAECHPSPYGPRQSAPRRARVIAVHPACGGSVCQPHATEEMRSLEAPWDQTKGLEKNRGTGFPQIAEWEGVPFLLVHSRWCCKGLLIPPAVGPHREVHAI